MDDELLLDLTMRISISHEDYQRLWELLGRTGRDLEELEADPSAAEGPSGYARAQSAQKDRHLLAALQHSLSAAAGEAGGTPLS